MKYQEILDAIQLEIQATQFAGEVATYIPDLAKVDPSKFGMHLVSTDNQHFSFGDCAERFSIQSISKVLSLTLALIKGGEELWKRVGVEPSGDPFNSLVQLEYENGIPRNPLINAGALVVCDSLVSLLANPKDEYLEFVKKMANNDTICYDESVAASEKTRGYHNKAMINLMKAFGNIHNDIDVVLDLYFHTCSLSLSCKELAATFLTYANHGMVACSEELLLSAKRTKRINALMQTCGFYDEAGEFAFKVGLPGKSGVGGGIVAVHPGKYSVAVWSPKLNIKGNSTAGIHALELLTNMTQSSIF